MGVIPSMHMWLHAFVEGNLAKTKHIRSRIYGKSQGSMLNHSHTKKNFSNLGCLNFLIAYTLVCMSQKPRKPAGNCINKNYFLKSAYDGTQCMNSRGECETLRAITHHGAHGVPTCYQPAHLLANHLGKYNKEPPQSSHTNHTTARLSNWWWSSSSFIFGKMYESQGNV